MMRPIPSAPTLIIGLGHHAPPPDDKSGGGYGADGPDDSHGESCGMIDLPPDFNAGDLQPGDEFQAECKCRLTPDGKAEVLSIEKDDESASQEQAEDQ